MTIPLHPVRAYRMNAKPPLKLAALARRIGTTKANLSRIESGKQQPSPELCRKLIAATGISADRLRPDLAALFRAPRAPRPGPRAA